MAKSNAVYWRDRKRQYDASLSKDEKRFYAKLATYYNREAARLDKEIAAYYAKYSVNGVLSYRNLLLALSDADKALLIEDIDAFARKYPEYADLVPVRESIYKLNRLEGLRQSIALQQMQMGAYEIQEATAFFQRQALRYANGAAEFLGLGSSFYRIDSDVIKAAVGNKWCDGKDFSQRIWNNRTKLGRTLQTDFANGVIRGDDYHRLAKMIQEKFKRVSQKSAERLAFTEDTYISNEAAMQAFLHESSVTQYQFVCTNDSHSCDLCKHLNGQTFEIKDRMPGENFPPMHPWCRCFFDVVVEKTLTSAGESGIIKAIDVDDFEVAAYGKEIHEEVSQTIVSKMQELERKGKFYISEVKIDKLSNLGSGMVALQVEPLSNGLLQLNINTDFFSGMSLEEIDSRFAESDKILANTLEEALIHESGHAKSISGRSLSEIQKMYDELAQIHIEGISKYARLDGAECLAEVEVLLSRGEKVPEEAMQLYRKYILREKQQ